MLTSVVVVVAIALVWLRGFFAFHGVANRLPHRQGRLQRLPLGRKPSGLRWRLNLREESILIGGIPGSGKSGVINCLLASLARRADVRGFGIDLKAGIELGPWSSWLDGLATTPEDAEGLLTRLSDLVDQRNADLFARGQRTVWNRLSARMPLYVLVIDEAAELFHASKRSAALIERILRLGRSAGVCVVLATQKPTTDAIPSAIRDLCGIRVALRTTTAEQTRATLGEVPPDDQPRPTRIKKGQRGRAVVHQSGDFQSVQFCWVGDRAVRHLVERAS